MEIRRLLMAHNYYRIPGGEEESFRSEMSMLVDHGHEVMTYTRDNDEIQSSGLWSQVGLFAETIWSKDSYTTIKEIIRKDKPQIAHFQNTFPLISPSVYYACKQAGVPVIQSLRNYRLMCTNGFFFRDGKPCEDCLGKFFAWPGIVHACYRQSRLQSAAVASMVSYHRVFKTWETQVDKYIALTEFSRAKFIEAGLPPEKIAVKPNYIPDPGAGIGPGDYVVFVGRLSDEKGVHVLLDAWKHLLHIPLMIVGEGPLMDFVREYILDNHIPASLLGRLSNEQALEVVKNSAFLVFPSLLYETFGRTIVEAFACGKPVVASRLGTALELIIEGETGLFFSSGDSTDLASKVNELWLSGDRRIVMGRKARQEYEEKYTREKNYSQLMAIYEQVSSGRS